MLVLQVHNFLLASAGFRGGGNGLTKLWPTSQPRHSRSAVASIHWAVHYWIFESSMLLPQRKQWGSSMAVEPQFVQNIQSNLQYIWIYIIILILYIYIDKYQSNTPCIFSFWFVFILFDGYSLHSCRLENRFAMQLDFKHRITYFNKLAFVSFCGFPAFCPGRWPRIEG